MAANMCFQIGTYIGMGSAIVAVGGLTGPPITGALISTFGSYDQAVVFSGCVNLLGMGFFVLARLSYGNGKLFV